VKTLADVALRRLSDQRLVRPSFKTAAEAVATLGAVQAQDYSGAIWAIAQRMRGATADVLERAMTEGSILRTHVLRPTWHFVTPADIRWMLALTAPRVSASMASYNRKLELDRAVFNKSNAAIERALRGGQSLTRAELSQVLVAAGVKPANGQRLGHLMMQAELDAVVCSGPRRGKLFTYALLDERAPFAPAREREDALAELARRFFATRGPASPQDFAWWSGLTVADAKRGIDICGKALRRDEIDGRPLWHRPRRTRQSSFGVAHLLPNYDEYFIGYKDRSAIGERLRANGVSVPEGALFAHIAFIDGQVVGGWKQQAARAGGVVVQLRRLVKLTAAERRALEGQVDRLGVFLGTSARLELT
jgi:hypothetical protein